MAPPHPLLWFAYCARTCHLITPNIKYSQRAGKSSLFEQHIGCRLGCLEPSQDLRNNLKNLTRIHFFFNCLQFKALWMTLCYLSFLNLSTISVVNRPVLFAPCQILLVQLASCCSLFGQSNSEQKNWINVLFFFKPFFKYKWKHLRLRVSC